MCLGVKYGMSNVLKTFNYVWCHRATGEKSEPNEGQLKKSSGEIFEWKTRFDRIRPEDHCMG